MQGQAMKKFTKEKPTKPGDYLMCEEIGLEDTDIDVKNTRVVNAYSDDGRMVIADWHEFGDIYADNIPNTYLFCKFKMPAIPEE